MACECVAGGFVFIPIMYRMPLHLFWSRVAPVVRCVGDLRIYSSLVHTVMTYALRPSFSECVSALELVLLPLAFQSSCTTFTTTLRPLGFTSCVECIVCAALIQRYEHLHIPYLSLHAWVWWKRVCLAQLATSSVRLPARTCFLPVLSLRVGGGEGGEGCAGNQTNYTSSRTVFPREESAAEGTASTPGKQRRAADPLSLAPRQQTIKRWGRKYPEGGLRPVLSPWLDT